MRGGEFWKKGRAEVVEDNGALVAIYGGMPAPSGAPINCAASYGPGWAGLALCFSAPASWASTPLRTALCWRLSLSWRRQSCGEGGCVEYASDSCPVQRYEFSLRKCIVDCARTPPGFPLPLAPSPQGVECLCQPCVEQEIDRLKMLI